MFLLPHSILGGQRGSRADTNLNYVHYYGWAGWGRARVSMTMQRGGRRYARDREMFVIRDAC
jgi:hypothetical protein